MADLVNIDDISTNRVIDPEDDLTELMASIEASGIEVPVLLTQDHDLIDGLRRIEASRRLGRTQVEAVATYMYPRACEVLKQAREHGKHAQPLTGDRVWEIYGTIHPLLFITRSHYSRGKTKGQKAPSAGGRVLLTKALGLASEGLLQAITQVHRALSVPETADKAAQVIELVRRGEISYYGALTLLRKQEGLTGNIVAPTEQRDVLSTSATSMRGVVRALQRLGPLHKKVTKDEVQERINDLAYARTQLNKVIKLLQEENNKR